MEKKKTGWKGIFSSGNKAFLSSAELHVPFRWDSGNVPFPSHHSKDAHSTTLTAHPGSPSPVLPGPELPPHRGIQQNSGKAKFGSPGSPPVGTIQPVLCNLAADKISNFAYAFPPLEQLLVVFFNTRIFWSGHLINTTWLMSNWFCIAYSLNIHYLCQLLSFSWLQQTLEQILQMYVKISFMRHMIHIYLC